jgi:hypothetical protein
VSLTHAYVLAGRIRVVWFMYSSAWLLDSMIGCAQVSHESGRLAAEFCSSFPFK